MLLLIAFLAVVVVAGIVIFWYMQARNVEIAHHTVVEADGAIEIRGYPALSVAEAEDMVMLRKLARDQLTAGLLAEVAQLDGIRAHFLAVTRDRRVPNPVVAELLAKT